MPHLDDRRRPPVGRDVDRQIRVVDHEQPRRLEVVHAPDEPDEVGELAAQPVAVRLEKEDVVELGVTGGHRAVDLEQVPVERRDPGGREDDAIEMDGEEGRDQADDAQEDARESVLDAAHPPP